MLLSPDLRPRACGGWMAMSPQTEALRFCVLGATENEARDRFKSSLACWEANLVATRDAASIPPIDETVEQQQPHPSP